MIFFTLFCIFSRFSQNCEKRLLASSCLSLCVSACLAVRMEQLGSHWTDFHEIWYLRIFRISAEESQFWLKHGRNNWVNEHLCTFMIFSWIVYTTWNVSDNSLKTIPTYTSRSTTFFWKSCRLQYNVEKYSDSQTGHRWQYNTVHTPSCCSNKGYRHTPWICNGVLPRQQWLLQRASMLRMYRMTHGNLTSLEWVVLSR
jgi:hypothetical protein